MGKLFFVFLGMSLGFTFLGYANGERGNHYESARVSTYGYIDTEGLKGLLDSQAPLKLLDARGDGWNDPAIIRGAELASSNFSDERLYQILPDFEQLIIVYCYSITCPFSARLADRLASLGYRNIVIYSEGLVGWRDVANYPIEYLRR